MNAVLLHSCCFRPDGRLDVKLYPTDEAEPWVIGGIGVSKDLGFGIVHDFPRVFQCFD